MTAVNGAGEGVVFVQGGKPISSFEPAMRFNEFFGFCARLGSFCLFLGNGPGNTALTWTLTETGGGEVSALAGRTATKAIARAAETSVPAVAMRRCDRRRFRVNQRGDFIDLEM